LDQQILFIRHSWHLYLDVVSQLRFANISVGSPGRESCFAAGMEGLIPLVAELPSHTLEADGGKVEMVPLIVMMPFERLIVETDNVGIPG
jgi:hypothetical protein